MNHIYRVIFNRSLGLWQVVGDCAKTRTRGTGPSRSRRGLTSILLGAAALNLAMASPSQAADLPEYDGPVLGSAQLQQITSTLYVTIPRPDSSSTVLNWRSFNIANGRTVDIYQLPTGQTLFNIVTGLDSTRIGGWLTANQLIAISNPNGLAVESSGQIMNAQSVLLTSLRVEGSNWPQMLLVDTRVNGEVNGDISNAGQITASGRVALAGPTVTNASGATITAGNIALYTSSKMVASNSNDDFTVSASPIFASGTAGTTPKILNAGTLTAAAGLVDLQASTVRSADSATTPVISNTGTITANSIRLAAYGGGIASSGTLDASGGTLTLTADADIHVTGRAAADTLVADSRGNVTLEGNNQITNLGSIQVDGNFSLKNGQDIKQAQNGSGIRVTGTARIDAGSGVIFLPSPLNDFGPALSLKGQKVDLYMPGQLTVDELDVSGQATLSAGPVTITGKATIGRDLFMPGGGNVLITGDVTAWRVGLNGHLFIGTGGTTGSVNADIVNNHGVTFHRSDALTYAKVINGTGAVAKTGAGTLTFNGVNTYIGGTDVQMGTLIVGASPTDSQASVAGPVRVRTGARLGGYGSVGATQVDSGGTLAAGGTGSAGALTINGNLVMQTGSTLHFALGAPSSTTALQVKGDLTLNGTGLRLTDGGGYASGVYMLAEADGLLNGRVGSIDPPPTGSYDILYGASRAQIMLIARDVNPLNFWNGNGSAGPGQFGGGDGRWTTTSPVWADAKGSATGAMFPQPGMAVFAGAPGIVTIDGTAGAVQATSLQFASTGYRLKGDVLTLTPGLAPAGPAEVRVGSGSLNSATYIAAVDNVLAGANGLAKTGAGTLVLNGANTYSGGTWLQGGTLSVREDANLGATGQTVTLDGGALRITGTSLRALPRAIVLGATGGSLDIDDAGNLFTVGNALTGPGSLAKRGAGTLALTGANLYTGGTSIQAGTLVAERDGALGAGPVDNAATLVLRNDASAAGLSISNSGIVDVSDSRGPAGDGRLSAGSIAGGGRYALGGNTLAVGANNASTEVSGVMADGGLAGGTGAALLKQGTGTLTLSGINTYTGATTVTGGTLQVNGSIAASSRLQVAAGATLGGSGVVGTTTIQTGGMLTPGAPGTTLSVAGDLTLQPGSRYLVQADPASTTSSRVAVTGRANLLGGSVLHAGPDGNFAPYATYTVLTAAGGVNGRFDDVRSNYAFLAPSLAYSANEVSLTLQRRPTGSGPIRFADAARSGNQRAVANALDSLPVGNPLHQRILVLPDGAPPAAFDNLSGEAHASIGSALYSGAATVRGTPFKYLRAGLAAPQRPGAPTAQAGASDAAPPAGALPGSGALPAWAEIIGNWQTLGGNGNAAKTTQRTGGLFVGADRAIGSGWRLGGALGYTDSNIQVDGRSSKSDVSAYSATLYGGKAFEAGAANVNLLLGAAYTWNDISTRRSVNTAGMDQTLKANYGASTSQVFSEIGYARPVGGGVTLEPFAGIAWADTRTRGFAESGGDAALSGRAKRESQTSTTLGLRGRTEIDLGRLQGTAGASLGWRHAFGDVNPATTLAFQDSQAFTVSGLPIARDTALIELSAEVALSRNASLGVNYGGQFGGGNRENSASVRLSWRY